jgi:hypothetical protein
MVCCYEYGADIKIHSKNNSNSMKNAVFRDVTPCDTCKNRRFRGKYRLHLQNEKSVAYRFSPDYWGDSSSETSVHTRATRHHIPADGILHSHSRENRKSYTIQIADARLFLSQVMSLFMNLIFFYWNPWKPRTLLQLKLVGILTINLFVI